MYELDSGIEVSASIFTFLYSVLSFIDFIKPTKKYQLNAEFNSAFN